MLPNRVVSIYIHFFLRKKIIYVELYEPLSVRRDFGKQGWIFTYKIFLKTGARTLWWYSWTLPFIFHEQWQKWCFVCKNVCRTPPHWQFFNSLFNTIIIYNINKSLDFPGDFIKSFRKGAEKHYKNPNHIGKQLSDNLYAESCLLRIFEKLKQIRKNQCFVKWKRS